MLWIVKMGEASTLLWRRVKIGESVLVYQAVSLSVFLSLSLCLCLHSVVSRLLRVLSIDVCLALQSLCFHQFNVVLSISSWVGFLFLCCLPLSSCMAVETSMSLWCRCTGWSSVWIGRWTVSCPVWRRCTGWSSVWIGRWTVSCPVWRINNTFVNEPSMST